MEGELQSDVMLPVGLAGYAWNGIELCGVIWD